MLPTRNDCASAAGAIALLSILAGGCSDSRGAATEPEPGAVAAGEAAGALGEANAAAIADPSAGPDARGLPAGAIHVEPAMIVDATGFERPMAASTLFLPRGWTTEGGVVWGREFSCTNGYALRWSARSPDGSMRIAVLPQERWESNNYGAPASSPGCGLAPMTNVRQYLEALASRIRPDARTVGYRVREDIQQRLAHLNALTPMPMGELRTWVEAGELTLDYDENGRAMRASVAAAAVFTLMRSNAGGMGSMDAFTGSTFPSWAASAPADQFDPGFFEALRRSIKPAPQWEAAINGHNAAIGRVALEESRKRSEIITRSNAEIAQIRSEAWEAQQESADRRAREFGEVIRGVETYDDGNAPGGQVELSGNYDNAWRLNDGSYVLTNDASFEPWRDLGLEGEKLGVTR